MTVTDLKPVFHNGLRWNVDGMSNSADSDLRATGYLLTIVNAVPNKPYIHFILRDFQAITL